MTSYMKFYFYISIILEIFVVRDLIIVHTLFCGQLNLSWVYGCGRSNVDMLYPSSKATLLGSKAPTHGELLH